MMNQKRPNAYLVGAPKAGSSALSVFLNQHPQVSVCQIKEPNFHCQDLNLPGPKTEDEYLSLFKTTSETKILLDGSILSLYSKKAAESIASYTPNAKIIAILRNPVEAIYAWHSQMVFTANEPILVFEEALNAEHERRQGKLIPRFGTTYDCPSLLFYSEIMDYAVQIKRFLEFFPEEQILILIYDDFKVNPFTEYIKILEFLDISPFEPKFTITNHNKVRKNLLLHNILKRFFAAPAKVILTPTLRLKIISILDRFNSVEKKRAPLDEKNAAFLKKKYKPQIIQLENLLKRDLHHWHQ